MEAHRAITSHNKSMGMKLFILSEAMTFAALLIAFGYLRWTGANWPSQFSETSAVYSLVMSACLFASSWTMIKGTTSTLAGNWSTGRRWILITVAFGLAFLLLHLNEWRHLARLGFSPLAPQSTSSDASLSIGSAFFGITGLHMLHVLSGIVLLVFLLFRRKPDKENVQVAGMYWQFVDAVWVFVFGVLYLPLIT